MLPVSMRQTLSADDEPNLPLFKVQLDKWLEQIPDQPTVPPGRWRPAKTNSILHQIEYFGQI